MRRRSERGARGIQSKRRGFVGRVVAGPTCVARRSKRLGGNMNEPDRDHLPIRRGAFQGVSNRTLDGSQPDWNLVGHPAPPAGAPNVLVVLIDDAGFGNPGTFGGPIDTPNYTRMADGGRPLQPLPRHRALLADAGGAADRPQQPRGRLRLDRRVLDRVPRLHRVRCRDDCAPFPRILRDNGYSTAAFGKWHLTPDGQQGPAGPFNRWPNGWGFDYFYGFLGGGSGQWDPCLAENQKIIGTARADYDDEEDPYYLPGRDGGQDDRVAARRPGAGREQAVLHLLLDRLQPRSAPRRRSSGPRSTRASSTRAGTSSARRPSPGRRSSGSSPPTRSSRRATRRSPPGTTCPDKLKAFYARQMEVYAGYSENADHNVGRVIDAIDELGELDNTLVLWIWGDNGASMEGTITGSFNELTMQNGIPLTDEMQLQLSERYGGVEAWGAPMMDPHYRRRVGMGGQHAVPVGKAGRLAPRRHPQPAGRALARPGHGQRRAPDPVHPRDRRRRRRSSTSPGSRRRRRSTGSSRSRCTATTFATSLTDGGAPEHRTQQYFETIGNRGMYKDGWWLAMKTERIPWVLTPEALAPYAPGVWDPDAGPAELYYLPDDFSQAKRPRRRAPGQGCRS